MWARGLRSRLRECPTIIYGPTSPRSTPLAQGVLYAPTGLQLTLVDISQHDTGYSAGGIDVRVSGVMRWLLLVFLHNRVW